MKAVFRTNLKQLLFQKEAKMGNAITRKQIQDATGISQVTISRWYNGTIDRVEAETVNAFCGYLGCNMADLIAIEESSNGQL